MIDSDKQCINGSRAGLMHNFFQDTVSLDQIDLFNMLNETKSDLEILSCKFMNQGCKDEWVDIVTVYGV